MRYKSLDVIRGYAALSVMLAHTLTVFFSDKPEIWRWVEWSPLRFLFAGHQAVIMFFVLSGFALTVMIRSMKDYSYIKYSLARIIRLWIPYAASIIFTYIVVSILVRNGHYWQNGWMGIAPSVITTSDVVKNLTMLGEFNPYSVNPPIWTLVQEMRISFLFPIVLMLASRFGPKAVFGSYVLSVACCIIFYNDMYADMAKIKDSLIFTLSFLSPFTIGCCIAINIKKISDTVGNLSTRMAWIIFIMSYLIYSYSFNRTWSASARLAGDILISLSSAIIICLSTKVKQGNFLRVGEYLGRISFSLYLTHISVLTVLTVMMIGKINNWPILLLMAPLSIILAHLFTKTIDSLSIRLSRLIYR